MRPLNLRFCLKLVQKLTFPVSKFPESRTFKLFVLPLTTYLTTYMRKALWEKLMKTRMCTRNFLRVNLTESSYYLLHILTKSILDWLNLKNLISTNSNFLNPSRFLNTLCFNDSLYIIFPGFCSSEPFQSLISLKIILEN